jgi:hypothetical protein
MNLWLLQRLSACTTQETRNNISLSLYVRLFESTKAEMEAEVDQRNGLQIRWGYVLLQGISSPSGSYLERDWVDPFISLNPFGDFIPLGLVRFGVDWGGLKGIQSPSIQI